MDNAAETTLLIRALTARRLGSRLTFRMGASMKYFSPYGNRRFPVGGRGFRKKRPAMKAGFFAVTLLAGVAAVVAARQEIGAPATAAAATGGAEVVRVIDGDTLRMSWNGREATVRLSQIDAPEDGQPWGAQSRDALARLVAGRDLAVITEGADTYGRTLVTLFADGENINAEMVKSGAAWAYRDYLEDWRLVGFESQARDRSIGLWSQNADEIVEPAQWRRAQAG
jgi:endonuclease YncB( thermonuclease family)